MVDKKDQDDEYQFEEHEEDAPVVTTNKPDIPLSGVSTRKKLLIGFVLVLIVFALIRILNHPSENSTPVSTGQRAPTSAQLAKAKQLAQEEAAQEALAKEASVMNAAKEAEQARDSQLTSLQANLQEMQSSLDNSNQSMNSTILGLTSQVAALQQQVTSLQKALQKEADENNPQTANAHVYAMAPDGQAWLLIPGNPNLWPVTVGTKLAGPYGTVNSIDTNGGTVSTDKGYVFHYALSYGQNLGLADDQTEAQ